MELENISCYRFDKTDEDSMIEIAIDNVHKTFGHPDEGNAAATTKYVSTPTDKSLCGFIFGIVAIDVVPNHELRNREEVEYNNYVAQRVLLRCAAAGQFCHYS